MSQPAFSLIVCIPGEKPVLHELGEGVVTFGRSPENGIQILVAEVSVRHGTFTGAGGVYRLADTGSTNGTKLNGVPVGAEGVELSPMDRIFLGTMVPAYFVPSAILDSTPIEELIASIEAAPKTAAPVAVQPKTAPVAVSAAAAPLPKAPPTGGATVRLDQVRNPGTGASPVRPAVSPLPPRQPVTGGPPRPPGVPPAGRPPVTGQPPKAPGAPPAGRPPVTGQPPKAPGAPPAGGPGAPQPLPLKRPLPGAATIPLPKLPPKPGGQ
ncbi:MAG TPA: FHA domain-containing protein [Verrucomicrobiales bacterium]|nr:FHA domain-containing protein [Verrucomicrobiales bacterium]